MIHDSISVSLARSIGLNASFDQTLIYCSEAEIRHLPVIEKEDVEETEVLALESRFETPFLPLTAQQPISGLKIRRLMVSITRREVQSLAT